jgi:hypothetical protein
MLSLDLDLLLHQIGVNAWLPFLIRVALVQILRAWALALALSHTSLGKFKRKGTRHAEKYIELSFGNRDGRFSIAITLTLGTG